MKAILYIRALTQDELESAREEALQHARAFGFTVVSEYADVGPAGFGRMSGFRRLCRYLARAEERPIVLVPRWSTIPVGPEHLGAIIERAEWRALENGDAGLASIVRSVVRWKREHCRERVRFAVRVARALKHVGRPKKTKHE